MLMRHREGTEELVGCLLHDLTRLGSLILRQGKFDSVCTDRGEARAVNELYFQNYIHNQSVIPTI